MSFFPRLIRPTVARFSTPIPRTLTKLHQTTPHLRTYRPPPPPRDPRRPSQWGKIPMNTGMRVLQHARPPTPIYKPFPGRLPPRGPLLIHAWRTKPGFRYIVYSIGGVLVVFYISNLEKVPVTGRWRFNCISSESEAEASEEMYQQILQQYHGRVYGHLHPYTRKVRRVLERLIAVSGMEGLDWEVHVIQDPEQKNAFVIPGGKVFVFSGILPLCSDDGKLAAVLSHEIAHNVAHHAAERMSKYFLILGTLFVVGLLLGLDLGYGNAIGELVFLRPSSRKQESEADYIGLMMMAQACYDPEDAKKFWERMKAAERNAPPQFLSTHPSSDTRIADIERWMPEARGMLEKSDCTETLEYADQFRRAFGYTRW